MTGWMEYAGAGIRYVSHDVDHIERIHELDSCFTVTLQTKGDDTAGTIWHVFLSKFVIGIVFQSTVMNPSYARVVVQKFCHLLSILTVLAHTQMQTLQTQVEDE